MYIVPRTRVCEKKIQDPYNTPTVKIKEYTGLFNMIVGVLTTCHTQYT